MSDSAPRTFAAFLFDMDGTLLTSTASVERIWGTWARDHGLDPAAFLRTIHGVPAADIIRNAGVPGIDPVVEGNRVMALEIADTDGTAPIAGVRAFLDSLPPARWAIVTSAQRPLALARLAAAGVPIPEVLVTAEDVTRGKPAPDPFEIGARRLGFDPADCLVFEDSPAGIASGEAAGAVLLVIAAAHPAPAGCPHRAIADYTGVIATTGADGRLALAFVAEPD